MASLALGVRFNPAAGGTTDFVYASTVTGYRVATSVLVNSKVYRYRAESADLSQWEYGTAIWSSATSTLSRNTITDSSNAGAKVNFSVAPQVAITIDVPDVLGFDDAMTLTTAQKKQAQSNLFVPPTTQSLTSGSAATYTTPIGCTWIEVFMVGGGGGGGGAANNSISIAGGSDGGTTTFNGVNAAPGKGATAPSSSYSVGGIGGVGGTGTATRRQRGGSGMGSVSVNATAGVNSGKGGDSHFGGGAPGIAENATAVGVSADANSGAGGSGAVNDAGTQFAIGAGGGAGEFVYLLIPSPAGTYTYTIGASGAGGVSTTNGGAGGSGFIFVIEHYGS